MANTHTRDLFCFLCINNKRYPLYTGHNIVGRNKRANVILTDVNASQQHALLTIVDNKIYVSDLKSSNSTFIDDTLLLPLHLYEIRDHCELKFGTVEATLVFSNKNEKLSENIHQRTLIESQVDDAVFGIETQLFEGSSNRVSTYAPVPIPEPSEADYLATNEKVTDRSDASKSKTSEGLTQIFWEAKKIFQPSDSQPPYSEAVISKSDSDTDDEIVTIQPTQDLADNMIKNCSKNESSKNLVKEHDKSSNNEVSCAEVYVDLKNDILIQKDINSEIRSSGEPSQVYKVKRTSSKRKIWSDSDDSDMEESILKQKANGAVKSLEGSASPQPIKLERKCTKQVIISDSGIDLDNDDELCKKGPYRKSTKALLFAEKHENFKSIRSKKSVINSENITESVHKKDLDNRNVKSCGDDPSLELFLVQNKAIKQVALADSDSSKLTTDVKSSAVQDESDNTDIEGDVIYKVVETSVKNVNSQLLCSDNDTDLDDDNNSMFSQNMQEKRTSITVVSNFENAPDVNDDRSDSENGKSSSGIKITETSHYHFDSDSCGSMKFDFNETNVKRDEEKEQEFTHGNENIDNKSNVQAATDDIITSSDEDQHVNDDNIVVKLCGDNQPLKNKYKWIRFNKESNTDLTTSCNSLVKNDVSINEYMDIKDITLYINSTKQSQCLNKTNEDSICDDVSFIPATQDVSENIEVCTNEILDTQEKVTQVNFSLGISDYINPSQNEHKLTNSKVINEGEGVIQKIVPIGTEVVGAKSEFDDNQELYLAATQQLIESNAQPHNVKRPEVDHGLILSPTQLICNNSCNIIDEGDDISIFAKPTQLLENKAEECNEEINNAIFLAPTKRINPGNNYGVVINDHDCDDEDDSIFGKATQKIYEKEPGMCEESCNENRNSTAYIALLQEEQNDDRRDSEKPSTSKVVFSQINCPDHNTENSQKSLSPSPTTCQGVDKKKLQSTIKYLADNNIDSRNAYNEPLSKIVEDPENIIYKKKIDADNSLNYVNACSKVPLAQNKKQNELKHSNSNLFNIPTQLVSNQERNLVEKVANTNKCDLPTENIIIIPNDGPIQAGQLSNQNENLELKSNDYDLFNIPTQILNEEIERDKTKSNLSDLFDLPTQIITNIPNNAFSVSTEAISTNKDAEQPRNQWRHIVGANLFEIETQIIEDKVQPSCSRNGKEIKRGVNKDKLVEDINVILQKNNCANKKITSNIVKNTSVRINKEEKSKLDKDIVSTPRVTRQKSILSINKGSKLKKRSKKISTENTTSLNNNESHVQVVQETIEQINLAITKMKDHIIEDEHANTVNKPMYCTQEVLNVLTSANHTEERRQYSKNSDELQNLKGGINEIPDISPDVSTNLSKALDEEDKKELILIKPKCVESITNRTSKRSDINNRNEDLNQKDELRNQICDDKSMYSTKEIIDVLSSVHTSTEAKEHKGTLTFVEPKNVTLKPIVKKSSKRRQVDDQSKNQNQADKLELKDDKSGTIFPTAIVLTSASASANKEGQTIPTFIKPTNTARTKPVKGNIKVALFSTQEVIEVLTNDEVDEDDKVLPRNVNINDELLTESAFMKDTEQLDIDLQSTMIKANDEVEGNQCDDDFKDIKRINILPSYSKANDTKHNKSDKNSRESSKIFPKFRKHISIIDSNLVMVHETPIESPHCSAIPKPVAKKHKFPQLIEDGDEQSAVTSIPPQKTQKLDKLHSASKPKSTKQKPILGILKKTSAATRTTRSTKEPTATTTLENIATADVVVSNVVKRGRPRKVENSNSVVIDRTNKVEVIITPASSCKDDTNKRPISQGKRGRPKKRTDSKIDLNVNNSDEAPPVKKMGGRRESSCSTKTEAFSNTLSSTPLSQRTKRLLKPKIVFTMLDSPELESLIRSLGGTVVESVEACTVLVTISVKRTEKLLTAVGLGKPICSDKWLKECKVQNKFVDPWCHIFRDPEAETKWDFSLEVSLERSQNKKLFQNYTIMLIVNAAQDILKKAIESTGGKCITTSRNLPESFVIVSVAENQKKFQKYVSGDYGNVIVVEPEAIFDAVLRQEIRFNMFKLG